MRIRRRWSRSLLIPLLALAAGCAEEAPEPAADMPQEEPAEVTPAPPASQPAEPAPATTGPLPEGVTAALVQQGQQVFTGPGICMTCHGSDATGTPLAPDLTDSEWLWVDPAAGDALTQIATLIRTGVSQPKEHPAPMPAMGGAQLSDEQIEAVAAYVYSLGQG